MSGSYKSIPSQTYMHPQLGIIHITARLGARRFTAHWRNGELYITIPKGISPEAYNNALNSLLPDILAQKNNNVKTIAPGWYRAYELFDVSVTEDTRNVTFITSEFTDPEFTHFRLSLGSRLDVVNDGGVRRLINKHLLRAGEPHFYDIMLTVRELAGKYGVSDLLREVSAAKGLKRLGSCSGNGVITISYAVAFLPSHLREYVITHELAHLLHHDHSAAFHETVNRFTGSREKELDAELRNFEFPFLK